MRIQHLYPRLPVFLQNAVCSLHGYRTKRLRYGHEFQRKLSFLRESEKWSASEIENYQDEKIREIAVHAYNTVPYYRRMFDECRLTPGDICGREDLRKLPAVTKENVRHHLRDFVSDQFPLKRLIQLHTSGSTGTAVDFYFQPETIQFQWAVWWRFRERFGVRCGDPHCNFTGKPAVPLTCTRPPFWRHDRSNNQFIVNMQQISPQKIADIVAFLNDTRLVFYSGYPSIIYQLCCLIEEANLSITNPPAVVMTGAEKLYDDQRQVMQSVLQCPVVDQYGMTEACGNASRCPHDMFHEDAEFGYIDLIQGEELPTGQGQLRCTGFSNFAMPLINYEVGDVGSLSQVACSCGRNHRPFRDFEGRTEDFVITPEGCKIRRFDYIFKDAQNVREAQVVQNKLGEITILIVKRHGYTSDDEKALLKQVRKMISPTVAVEFEYVEEIERTSSGKFRAVVSNLCRDGDGVSPSEPFRI